MKKSIIVKKSKINKLGVFAAKDFKKGEVVLKWQPKKLLSKAEVDKLPDSKKHYVSNYTPGKYLFQQPPERYVNHSCEPNTEVIKNFDVASRDIKKGDEITSDYTKDNIQIHFECHCGSKNCRKFI